MWCKLWTLDIGVLCEREQLTIILGLVAIACRVLGPLYPRNRRRLPGWRSAYDLLPGKRLTHYARQ
jgi:hypothetical protein